MIGFPGPTIAGVSVGASLTVLAVFAYSSLLWPRRRDCRSTSFGSRAYTRPFLPVRRLVRSNLRRYLSEHETILASLRRPHAHRAEAVLNGSRLPLPLRSVFVSVVVPDPA